MTDVTAITKPGSQSTGSPLIGSLSIRVRITVAVACVAVLVAVVASLTIGSLLRSRVTEGALASEATLLRAESEFYRIEASDPAFGLGGVGVVGESVFYLDDVEIAYRDPVGPTVARASLATFETAAVDAVADSTTDLLDQFGGPAGEMFLVVAPGVEPVAVVSDTGDVTTSSIDAIAGSGGDIVVLDRVRADTDRFDPYQALVSRADPSTGSERELAFDAVDIDGVSYAVIVDVSDELNAVDEVLMVLGFAGLALVVGIIIATWLICSRALRPVHRLTQEVNEISAKSLSKRVPVGTAHDEVGELATTMNNMLDRLETSQRLRTQFVADASHELRTPVAVLQNQADVAMLAPRSTTVEHLAGVVVAESRRLGSLVNDLLVLARFDELASCSPEGAPRTSRSTMAEVDLDEIILDEAARRRRVPIDRSLVGAGRIRGDEESCRQIVAHLLDNAARHADNAVAVGINSGDDGVVVWVEDDGRGVPEAEREQIFERFARLDEARTRDQGGAGLGLAVVRANAAEMGGTARVVDAEVLGGARFEVALPVA